MYGVISLAVACRGSSSVVSSLPELFAFIALRAFVACDLWGQSLQIIVAEPVLREQRAPTRAHSVWIVTLHAFRCCLDQDRRGEKIQRFFVGSALISCVVNDFTSEHTKCLTTPHNLARPIESTEVDSNKLQINFKSLLIPSDPLKSVSKQSNSIQIHLKPIHILANLFNY